MIPDTLEISDTAAVHLQDLYTKCGGFMFIAEMEEMEAVAGGLEKKKTEVPGNAVVVQAVGQLACLHLHVFHIHIVCKVLNIKQKV